MITIKTFHNSLSYLSRPTRQLNIARYMAVLREFNAMIHMSRDNVVGDRTNSSSLSDPQKRLSQGQALADVSSMSK